MAGEIKTLQFSEGTATSAPSTTDPLVVGTPTNTTTHAINGTHLTNVGMGMLNKLDATTGPTVNDDTDASSPGYAVGSL